jgi:hypothetical protein
MLFLHGKNKRRSSVHPNPAWKYCYVKLITIATTAAAAAAAAVTAATTAAATESTTTTTAASRTVFARTGNVNGQGTTAHVFAIQAVNSLLGFFGAAHGYKTKTARAVGGAIHHQVGLGHGAELGKGILQVILGDIEGKVSNE